MTLFHSSLCNIWKTNPDKTPAVYPQSAISLVFLLLCWWLFTIFTFIHLADTCIQSKNMWASWICDFSIRCQCSNHWAVPLTTLMMPCVSKGETVFLLWESGLSAALFIRKVFVWTCFFDTFPNRLDFYYQSEFTRTLHCGCYCLLGKSTCGYLLHLKSRAVVLNWKHSTHGSGVTQLRQPPFYWLF